MDKQFTEALSRALKESTDIVSKANKGLLEQEDISMIDKKIKSFIEKTNQIIDTKSGEMKKSIKLTKLVSIFGYGFSLLSMGVAALLFEKKPNGNGAVIAVLVGVLIGIIGGIADQISSMKIVKFNKLFKSYADTARSLTTKVKDPDVLVSLHQLIQRLDDLSAVDGRKR